MMKKGILFILGVFSFCLILFSTKTSELNLSTQVYTTVADALINKDIDNHLYYNQLTESQKEIYDCILQGANNFQSIIVFNEEHNHDDLIRAVHAFCYEHPEFYWINPPMKYYRYENDSRIIKVDFESNETLEERKETFNKLNNLADDLIGLMRKLKLSEYNEMKFIHDYLINNVTYDKSDLLNWSIKDILLSGKGVCTNYTRAFQFLMNKAGYECYFIRGIAKNEDHVWNLVKYNHHYYWTDVTWDDKNLFRHEYFLIDDSFFNDHSLQVNGEFDIFDN